MTFPYTAVPHYAEEALTAKGERMVRKVQPTYISIVIKDYAEICHIF